MPTRQQLLSLLGDLPPLDRPISSQLLSTEPLPQGTLHRLSLTLNDTEPVPAYLLTPNTPAPHPAILYNHSHGGRYAMGKDELLTGTPYLAGPYAPDLLSAGYAVLSIDHFCFGQRNHTSESDTFKHMLWSGQVLWGMMVHDSLRALDFLSSHPLINPSRIATLGMSMGSTMAQWTAALDDRIKVTVDLCCLTDFQSLLDTHHLKGHGLYYFVPSLLKHFTASDINALIAPRPHLSLNGSQDPLTPLEGLHKINSHLTQLYTSLHHPQNWRLSLHNVPHLETPSMRAEALSFLHQHL